VKPSNLEASSSFLHHQQIMIVSKLIIFRTLRLIPTSNGQSMSYIFEF